MVSCFYTLYTSLHNSAHDHESSTIIEEQTFNGHLTGWFCKKRSVSFFFENERSVSFFFEETIFFYEQHECCFHILRGEILCRNENDKKVEKVSPTRHSSPLTPVTFFFFFWKGQLEKHWWIYSGEFQFSQQFFDRKTDVLNQIKMPTCAIILSVNSNFCCEEWYKMLLRHRSGNCNSKNIRH